MSSSGSGPGTLPAGTTDSGVAESGARGAVQHRCDTYAALPRELVIPSRIGAIPLSPYLCSRGVQATGPECDRRAGRRGVIAFVALRSSAPAPADRSYVAEALARFGTAGLTKALVSKIQTNCRPP